MTDNALEIYKMIIKGYHRCMWLRDTIDPQDPKNMLDKNRRPEALEAHGAITGYTMLSVEVMYLMERHYSQKELNKATKEAMKEWKRERKEMSKRVHKYTRG